MRRANRTAILVAATTCTALLASSCGSSGDESDDTKKSKPKAHAADINPQPVSKLKDGGTLTIPNRAWVSQYNPYQVDGGQMDARYVFDPVLPDLFNYDSEGEPSPNKNVLLSAKATTEHGKQVITYTFNPKAKWSNGEPIGWKDLKAIWKADNGENKKYMLRDSSGYEDIESVTQGSDKNVAKVTMKKPQAEFERLFSNGLVPASTIDTPKKFNKGWIGKIPLSGGPYKVKKMDKTAKTVTLERNPKWWGKKPKLDKIIIRTLDGSAQVEAFANQELDITEQAATAESYKRLKNAKGSEIRIGAPWDMVNLTFGKRGPMADVRVRQAMMKAVNRNAVSKINSKGLPVKFPPVGNHFLIPSQKGYQENSGEYGKYSPEDAKKLLEKAGWKAQDKGPRTKNGKPLDLTFVMSGGSSKTSLDTVDAIQHMMKQIGVKVKISKVSDTDFFDKYINRSNFDITLFRWMDATTLSDSYATYRMPKKKQVYSNFGRISSPKIDKLMRKGMHAANMKEARADFNKADRLLWKAGHSMELFQNYQLVAAPKKLANYGATGLRSTDWTKVGWMK